MNKLSKKEALESSLFKLVQEQPFYGNLLQELNIQFSQIIPTACILYNKKKDHIELHLNEQYFCQKPIGERQSILMHEILHFCHQHLWRYMAKKESDGDQFLFNIAADMAINQYIVGLPKDCVNVANFKQKDGTAFPTFKTMEFYWELLEQTDGKQSGDEKDKNGKSKQGEGKGRTPNQDVIEQYKASPFDEHKWEELTEEEKQKLLEEAKKLIKRTIEKTQFGHSSCPDSIKDLLEQVEAQIQGINYKQILKMILKRTICANDRDSTWNRPSKRYGVFAKGTTLGRIPNIAFFCDTSGSISYTEMNEFYQTVDGFLKLGQKSCKLGLWHTALYKVLKYKNAHSLKQQDLESGGTDVTPALEYIAKTKPDLAIILTDGCFSESNVKVGTDVVWVISKTGSVDHPMKKLGKTIQIK